MLRDHFVRDDNLKPRFSPGGDTPSASLWVLRERDHILRVNKKTQEFNIATRS
jgi:hypothetical protein